MLLTPPARHVPLRRRAPARPAVPWRGVVLAVLVMLALLLAFNRTVHQSVTQGVERRAAVQDRANAAWRCSVMADRLARAACRERLP